MTSSSLRDASAGLTINLLACYSRGRLPQFSSTLVKRFRSLQRTTGLITVTSQWARWRLKSPISPLFTQPFIQAKNKETSKLRVSGLCVGNSPVTGEFPTQMASNAKKISIWWRHHDAPNRTCSRYGMGKLSASLILSLGKPPITGGFPHKGPVIRCFLCCYPEQAVEQTAICRVFETSRHPYDVTVIGYLE